MKKTLICFAITIALTISLLPADAGNANINNETAYGEYETALSILINLGIAENSQSDPAHLVTRAEYTDLIIKAVNAEPSSFEPLFTDVTDSTTYAGSVITAAHLGIIDGNGKGKFKPNDPIELNAAIKMSVAALGYNDIAWLNGGYPYGYIKIADELDMTENISSENSVLSYADACVLIANMLKSDMCVVTGISSEGISAQRKYGVCPLSEYFHLTKIEGIVKTVGYASLSNDNDVVKARFVIDSQTFYSNMTDAEKFLGHKVTAWYDENKTINIVYIDPGYSVILLDGADIESYDKYIISTYDEATGKSRNYRLSRSYTFVKNGRGYINTDQDFLTGYGSFELIDNDGDHAFDVVKAKIPQYMVVSSKDLYSQTVFDNGGISAVLKNDDNGYCLIEKADKNGNLVPISISEIKTGAVITLYRSADELYTEAIVSEQTVKGSVGELTADSVIIGDVEYKINSRFTDFDKLSFGYTYKFLLAADKTVTGFSVPNSDSMQYGYLKGFKRDSSPLSDKVNISVVDENGEVNDLELSSKILFNAKMLKCDDAQIISELSDGSSVKPQLIRYQLNSDGYVSKIDTAAPPADTTDMTEKYKNAIKNDDSLTLYLQRITSHWESSSQVLSPHVYMGGQTVIFLVSDEIFSNPESNFDDKYFRVITTASLEQGTITYDAFDLDESFIPGAIVVYTGEGMSDEPHKLGTLGVVESMTKGIDNNNNDYVYKLLMWRGGAYNKYNIDQETYDKFKQNNKIPVPGDIVRINLDQLGYINGIAIDANYNSVLKRPVITSSARTGTNAPNEGQAYTSCYTGKVYSCKNGSLVLILDSDGYSGFNSSYSDDFNDNMAVFKLGSSVKCALYDTKCQMVKQGNADMLKSAVAVGEENASRVFLQVYMHNIQAMCIYE